MAVGSIGSSSWDRRNEQLTEPRRRRPAAPGVPGPVLLWLWLGLVTMSNSKELPPDKLQIGLKKTLMSTLFAGTGAFVVFRPLYLSTVISASQVGQIMLIGSVITTFTNPIISAAADSMQAQKGLMLLSTAGQAATQLAMLFPGIGYAGQLVLCTLHSLVGAHGFPTLDASIQAVCPERYGEIRLLGSAAFGLAAFFSHQRSYHHGYNHHPALLLSLRSSIRAARAGINLRY
eukprot:COSAG02_NODE_15493_length_1166_cov_0.767573_1_plen_232_part_00